VWDGHDGMGWWMLFGSVGFVILWGLIIWAVVTVVSKLGGGQSSEESREDTPFDIAKRRYARGEITKDQFDQMRRDLGET
jgi:putative membrane protein